LRSGGGPCAPWSKWTGAEAAIRARLATNPALDTRRLLERLLQKLDTMTSERLLAVRVLTVLERAGGSEARRMVTDLGKGDPRMRRTREARAVLKRMAQRR
jgi:hypothetical protein